jgi:predicted transcriptional regulator
MNNLHPVVVASSTQFDQMFSIGKEPILSALVELGIPQNQIAGLFNVSPPYVHALLNGKRRLNEVRIEESHNLLAYLIEDAVGVLHQLEKRQGVDFETWIKSFADFINGMKWSYGIAQANEFMDIALARTINELRERIFNAMEAFDFAHAYYSVASTVFWPFEMRSIDELQ